jgi:hypothetical protein
MIYIFVYNYKISSQVCSSFFRARNSPIEVKYYCYSAACYYLTPYRTLRVGGGATLNAFLCIEAHVKTVMLRKQGNWAQGRPEYLVGSW